MADGKMMCPACGKEAVIEQHILITNYGDEYGPGDENLEPGLKCSSCGWQESIGDRCIPCIICVHSYKKECNPNVIFDDCPFEFAQNEPPLCDCGRKHFHEGIEGGYECGF